VPPGSFRKVYRQLPATVIAGFDNLGDVNGALQQLELGQFSMAAIMADQMYRSIRYAAVLRTRVDALKTVPLVVKPADERRKSRLIAEQLGGVDGKRGEWDEMYPANVLGDLNKWGNLLGIAVAEQVWTTTPDSYRPRFKPWHPQFIRWDWSTFSYKLLTGDGLVELPRIDENPRGDGKWFVWCPYGYHYAWMQGLVRPLGDTILQNRWDSRDWSRHNEIHGQPTRKAIVPAGGDGKANDKFFDDVANAGSEPTILTPQGAEGNKFDVDLLEATAKTWETFQAKKADGNTDIAILMLGQNLTTEAKSGGLGGGQVQAHETVRKDKLKIDADITTAIRQQSLSWYAQFNFGDVDLAPIPGYEVEPPEDKQAKATTLAALMPALAAAKTATLPVDERATLEDFDVALISEEEQAANEDEAAAQAAQIAAGAANGAPAGQQDAEEPAAQRAALSAAGAVVKRYTFQGLPIAVENARGSMRHWHDPDGNVSGSTMMRADYGYIEGHMGSDGEDLDCYVCGDESAPDVHVVHQTRAPEYRAHDEDKIFLGAASADAARAMYVAHRNDGDRAIGGMSSMPLERFKAKLKARTGTGKVRASANDMVEDIMALVLRANEPRTLRAKSKARYADGLTTKATALAARALAADLAAIKDEIAKATDFKDLERRLLARYAKMDPKRLASVVQKTRLMAHLGGQLSAVKETT